MKLLRFIAELGLAKAVGIAAIFTYFYYSSYFDDGKTLETQIASVSQEVATEETRKGDIEKTIKKEDEMRANLNALARDLQVVKAKIPNDLKDTEVTAIINKAGQASGIEIQTLSKKKNPQAPPGGVKGSESVEEVAFDISLNCVFSQLVHFLEILANEEKILKIRDFSIERLNKANIDDSKIRFSGDIIGFKQSKGVK